MFHVSNLNSPFKFYLLFYISVIGYKIQIEYFSSGFKEMIEKG